MLLAGRIMVVVFVDNGKADRHIRVGVWTGGVLIALLKKRRDGG